jgi:hypothetical protein
MSDKPVLERLQVKGGRTLAVVDAPDGIDRLGGAVASPLRDADVVLVFCPDRARLEASVPEVASRMKPGAVLWVAYPKLTSSLAGDLNRNLIHDRVRDWGLETVSQIAVDADWSGMRMKRP